MVNHNLQNRPIRLLSARLGFPSDQEIYYTSQSSVSFSSPQEGLTNNASRLMFRGGYPQQDRMIRDKRQTLNRAVLYSYQGAVVRKVNEEKTARALINPDKVKQDYDDKIISIGYEFGYQPGDVFEWINTGSYWLIYLQDKTELAYFRGEIRRCRYTINYQDQDGNQYETYAAVRGPVETKIDFIQKAGISVERPNHSLNILLPASQENLDYFNRYSKFYLKEDGKKICWRVEATDWISTPGILQINAVEYYANEFEDDIENGIAGGLIVKEENPNTERVENYIRGETFIKPKGTYEYKFMGFNPGEWFIDNKYPVKYNVKDEHTIEIMWNSNYSGQFVIKNGALEKTIVVESLF